MMRVLQTPSGFQVEDREEGLFLIGDIEAARAFTFRDCDVAVTREDDGRWRVEVEPDEHGVGHEWGVDMDEETAWRYALGAHFGSHEDPEVEG